MLTEDTKLYLCRWLLPNFHQTYVTPQSHHSLCYLDFGSRYKNSSHQFPGLALWILLKVFSPKCPPITPGCNSWRTSLLSSWGTRSCHTSLPSPFSNTLHSCPIIGLWSHYCTSWLVLQGCTWTLYGLGFWSLSLKKLAWSLSESCKFISLVHSIHLGLLKPVLLEQFVHTWHLWEPASSIWLSAICLACSGPPYVIMKPYHLGFLYYLKVQLAVGRVWLDHYTTLGRKQI